MATDEAPTRIEVTDALERAWDLFMEEILGDQALQDLFVGGKLSPFYVTRLFDIALRAQEDGVAPAPVGVVLPTLAGIRRTLDGGPETDGRPNRVPNAYTLNGDDEDEDDDIGTVRWFGTAWPSPEHPAPVCDPRTHVDVPIGEQCPACTFAFGEADSGVGVPTIGTEPVRMHYLWWHLHCWLAQVGITPEVLAGLDGHDGRAR